MLWVLNVGECVEGAVAGLVGSGESGRADWQQQGWTRTYETVTMNNISRTKRNAEIEGVAKGEAVGGWSATRKLSRNH